MVKQGEDQKEIGRDELFYLSEMICSHEMVEVTSREVSYRGAVLSIDGVRVDGIGSKCTRTPSVEKGQLEALVLHLLPSLLLSLEARKNAIESQMLAEPRTASEYMRSCGLGTRAPRGRHVSALDQWCSEIVYGLVGVRTLNTSPPQTITKKGSFRAEGPSTTGPRFFLIGDMYVI